MAIDAQHGERVTVRRITRRNVQNRSVRIRAVLAPIESRMRVEYLQTAHEHEEYTQCVYPMQNASRSRVSIDGFGATHGLPYARPQRSIQSPGVAILSCQGLRSFQLSVSCLIAVPAGLEERRAPFGLVDLNGAPIADNGDRRALVNLITAPAPESVRACRAEPRIP